MQIKISLPSELVDTYRGWNGEKELLSSALDRSYVYNAPLCGGLLPRSILLLLLFLPLLFSRLAFVDLLWLFTLACVLSLR